jgi:hypothetical protein
MANLTQKTMLTLSSNDIEKMFWSVPHWQTLSQSPCNKGMVRHHVTRLKNYIKHGTIDLKPLYSEHAQNYLDHSNDPMGKTPKPLLAWGTRNTFQNLGLPGWHSERTPRLLRRVDEPWNDWTYHALCKFKDKSLKILALKFKSSQGDKEPDTVEIMDDEQLEPQKLEWAVTGQPLLWDGEVPPLALLAACTYDMRHIWHLQWEDWQDCKKDQEIHTKLMETFMDLLTTSIEDRAAALSRIAALHGLPITDAYLHSSVGLTEKNELVLLMCNGSLTDMGYAQKSLGSQRAILLDNGGSVGAAYWSKYNWKKNKEWPNIKDSPVYIGNESYFRSKGHAVIVAELKEDIMLDPLRDRPSGLVPWNVPNHPM